MSFATLCHQDGVFVTSSYDPSSHFEDISAVGQIKHGFILDSGFFRTCVVGPRAARLAMRASSLLYSISPKQHFDEVNTPNERAMNQYLTSQVGMKSWPLLLEVLGPVRVESVKRLGLSEDASTEVLALPDSYFGFGLLSVLEGAVCETCLGRGSEAQGEADGDDARIR